MRCTASCYTSQCILHSYPCIECFQGKKIERHDIRTEFIFQEARLLSRYLLSCKRFQNFLGNTCYGSREASKLWTRHKDVCRDCRESLHGPSAPAVRDFQRSTRIFRKTVLACSYITFVSGATNLVANGKSGPTRDRMNKHTTLATQQYTKDASQKRPI